MKMGGEIRPDWVLSRHWEKFAREIEVKQTVVIDLLKEYADKLPEEAKIISKSFCKEQGGMKIVNKVLGVIHENAKSIR